MKTTQDYLIKQMCSTLLKSVKEEECVECRGALHHINKKGRGALKAKGGQDYFRQIAISRH